MVVVAVVDMVVVVVEVIVVVVVGVVDVEVIVVVVEVVVVVVIGGVAVVVAGQGQHTDAVVVVGVSKRKDPEVLEEKSRVFSPGVTMSSIFSRNFMARAFQSSYSDFMKPWHRSRQRGS